MAIVVRIQPTLDGLHVPTTLWRHHSDAGATINERHSDASLRLSTIAQTPVPCVNATAQDIIEHRTPALFCTMYDFEGNEALLTRVTACPANNTHTLGVGYGSPALDALYAATPTGHRNFSILISADGKEGAMAVGRDIHALQNDPSILRAVFIGSSTTGMRELTLTDVNGHMLIFPVGIGIDVEQSRTFLSCNVNESNVLLAAQKMPFTMSLDGGVGKAPVHLPYATYPDRARSAVPKTMKKRSMLGLGFCVGKCITFDDENHCMYIQDVGTAWPALPSIRKVKTGESAKEELTHMEQKSAAADDAVAAAPVYDFDGNRIEPNIQRTKSDVLPDAQQHRMEQQAHISSQICDALKTKAPCNATPPCRWNNDTEICYETFYALRMTTVAVLVLIPLAYVAYDRWLSSPPLWQSYPDIVKKAYQRCNGLTALIGCVLLFKINFLKSHAAYRRLYTSPLVVCAISMSLLPLVLGLCVKYNYTFMWLVPLTLMAIVGVINIVRTEFHIARHTSSYSAVTAYVLLFNFVFLDGMIWWLLYLFSK
jgi:hypothetical protein